MSMCAIPEGAVTCRRSPLRQALNEALKLEMRRDPNVIVMGEDVCGGAGASREKDAWGGAFGVTKGILGEFGPERIIDTPITESAFVGAAAGAAVTGLEAGRRDHVRRLPRRMLRPNLQSGRQVPLHVRRQGGDADGSAHDLRCRLTLGEPA